MAVGGDAGRAQLDSLTPFERTAFRLVRRMNQGRWKRFWCWCGRQIGARWIDAFVGSRLEVFGLERVAGARRDRPLLLAANHRSFFDMYVVTSLLFRRTTGWRDIYFPVRGRFFYQSPLGVLVNFLGSWWAMYPPSCVAKGKGGSSVSIPKALAIRARIPTPSSPHNPALDA
jgi:1-acyl-sn-glycerol-3-phosphate acyltransferase